jgi:hypothetical protein
MSTPIYHGADVEETGALAKRWAEEDHARELERREALNLSNKKIRDARLKAIEDEKRARAERRRAEAEAQLKERLRAAFFQGNPMASPADFDKLYPRLREEHMVREAREAPEREKRALLAAHGADYTM